MTQVVIVFVLCLRILLVSSSQMDKSTSTPEDNFTALSSVKNICSISVYPVKMVGWRFMETHSGFAKQYQHASLSRVLAKKLKTIKNERQTYSDDPATVTPSPSNPPLPTSPSDSTSVSTPCYACVLIPLVTVAIVVSVSVTLSTNPVQARNFNPNAIVVNASPKVIPQNFPISNTFGNFPDDGCGRGGVRFNNQTNCYPLLRPCENPLFWTTVDPLTKRGRCSPRLCGRERVFVGRTQLCHDIEDPSECTGGRRLYYTAYGDPICDCPVGSYPFPTERDNCVPLFTQGPCPTGQVFTALENGFGCAPAECQPPSLTNFLQQLVPGGDGFCYPLGSRGSCSEPSELLGFDVLKRETECVDISNALSPYFESAQLNDLLDRTYNQRSAELDFDVTLVSQSLLERNDSATGRQDLNTFGIFQLPTLTPTTLLNPCRPGPNGGDNYKCSNPLVPNLRRRILLQAVRSAFACARNTILKAKGTCGGSMDESNCGPTYELFNLNNRCEKSIF